MKLGELAARLGCKLDGVENIEIRGVAGIEKAKAGEVTFLSNPKYFRELAKTHASAVFVDEKSRHRTRPRPSASCRPALTKPIFRFRARDRIVFSAPVPYAPGIHPTAVVAKSAKIGEGAHIGPHCFVDEESGNRAQRGVAQHGDNLPEHSRGSATISWRIRRRW